MLSGLNFGVLGALTNSFLNIPFYGHFSFYFGQIFVILCLVTRGLNAAFIAAIISSFALVTTLSDPFIFVILVSEVLVLHSMLRQEKFLLQSDLLFWACIGIPLSLFLLYITTGSSSTVLIISGLTLGINATFTAAIAALVYSFIPIHSPYRKYKGKPPKFSAIIFSLCMLTVILPTVVISSVYTWQNTSQKENDIATMLKRQSTEIMYSYDAFINLHLKAVSTLSSGLASTSEPDQFGTSSYINKQNLLNATIENHPGFTSMLISDSDGRITHAAPLKYAEMLSDSFTHTLDKRQYFQDAKLQGTPQLSDAIVGTGFGSNAILTVSAPILGEQGFDGISQGAILLSSLTSYTEQLGYTDEKPQYIITDKNNAIIYASPSLGLSPLSQFDFKLTTNTLIQAIPTLNHQNNPYLFEQTVNEHGWTTTVLVSPTLVTDIISSNFYVLALSLIITLFIFSIIANLLSKRITLPLVHLAEHFDDQSYTDEIRKESEISDELVKVTGQLINSREIMLNFQEQLTRQVQSKTKQLKSLNQQLYNLAQKDGLTNLLNRSGFDDLAHTSFRNCVRNNIPLTLVLLDIDDFKLINDTHGHPFGDKCIVSIAKTLNQFCKRNTDILGRYGGEEFILFLSGGNIEEHHELVKRIHRTIQKSPISSDSIIVNMTVSIGVTSLHSNYSMSFEGAVKSADEQLYKSKRTGKNKISIYVQ